MPGDRNSYYAKQNDGASVRSGRPGHVRTESVGGTNPGANTGLNSPLAELPCSDENEKAEKDELPVARAKDDGR